MIRSERSSDIAAIGELLTNAFGSTEESLLVEDLRNSSNFISDFSLVSIEGDLLSGYLLLFPIKIKYQDQETPSLALAPMAVLPEKQRQGYGSALVKEGLARARSAGWGSIIVVGHPDYYPKFGFELANKWNLSCPFDLPTEVFMALELKKGSIIPNGYVEYPDPFLS